MGVSAPKGAHLPNSAERMAFRLQRSQIFGNSQSLLSWATPRTATQGYVYIDQLLRAAVDLIAAEISHRMTFCRAVRMLSS
jgi:hypothetical protein